MGYIKDLLVARDMRNIQLATIAHHTIEDVRIKASPRPTDIICLVCTRNEMLRLPDFLRHHRELGVARFAVLDNGSEDGTLEYLLDQPDVDVFSVSGSFSEARGGMYWRERLAARYGYGRWYLIIDADELLVYSGMQRRNLHDLAKYLTGWGSKALLAPMIDMYSDKPLSDYSYVRGDRLIEACRFFDGSSYKVHWHEHQIIGLSGGPRVRLLSNETGAFGNYINKYPFFFWDRSVRRRNIHNFYAYRHKPGPSGALLHFKFLPDFGEQVDRALKDGQYWNHSTQYKIYASNLAALSHLYYPGSIEYASPDSLVNQGLMNRIHWSAKRPTKSVIKAILSGRPLTRSFEIMDGAAKARPAEPRASAIADQESLCADDARVATALNANSST